MSCAENSTLISKKESSLIDDFADFYYNHFDPIFELELVHAFCCV